MKETRTINISGSIFHIDYDAYISLNSYLQDIELRLSTDERAEVMADIENRISELLQNNLFARNVQVVDINMIQAIQEQLGAPSEFGENKRPKVKHSSSQHSGCARTLGICLVIIALLSVVPIMIPAIVIIIAIIAAIMGISVAAVPILESEPFGVSMWIPSLCVVLGLLAIILPVVMILYTIIRWLRLRKGPSARFWIITIVLWIVSVSGVCTCSSVVADHIGGWQKILQCFDINVDDDNDELCEQRPVSPYTQLVVTGTAKISLHYSTDYQIQVRGNQLSDVRTEVKDGVLFITTDDDRYAEVSVDLYLPTITSVQGTGACELEMLDQFSMDSLLIKIDGVGKGRFRIDAHYISAAINGAGQLNLEGESYSTDLHLAGAGRIQSEWLHTRVMHINCAGASKAEIYADKELWAQATGASFITYKGTPTIKQKLAVGGSAIRKN